MGAVIVLSLTKSNLCVLGSFRGRELQSPESGPLGRFFSSKVSPPPNMVPGSTPLAAGYFGCIDFDLKIIQHKNPFNQMVSCMKSLLPRSRNHHNWKLSKRCPPRIVTPYWLTVWSVRLLKKLLSSYFFEAFRLWHDAMSSWTKTCDNCVGMLLA